MTSSRSTSPAGDNNLRGQWQAVRAALVRYFHAYGNWLVSISWWRFFLISILVLVLAAIMASIFGGNSGHHHRHEVVIKKTKPVAPPEVPSPTPANEASGPAAKGKVSVQIDQSGVHISAQDPQGQGAQLQIDERGVRISTPSQAPASAAQGASAAQAAVDIQIGPNATEQEIEQA